MRFDTNWDVDKYRSEHESNEHWKLRRQFMLAHKNNYPESRLVCLTQVFFNMEFLGCRYPEKTMKLVNQMASEVAQEFRDARKGKLKRTFVGAQDAAGAKAKGAKPPSGEVEGSKNNVEKNDSLDGPPPKKSHQDDAQPTKKSSTDVVDLDSDSEDVVIVENLDVECTGEELATLQECAKKVILWIPIRPNSKNEEDPFRIMKQNFTGSKFSFSFEGNKKDGWNCVLKVNPSDFTGKPILCLATSHAMTQRDAKLQASAIALHRLKKFCTVIQPNPEWFKNGETPDFIRDRKPCTKNPRSYIIMTKKETGYITAQVADILLTNFKKSFNEDVFFPNEEYSESEKKQLMNRCQVHNLGFRHFGLDKMLKGHNVCIYKVKTPSQILEEAKKLNWKHPKWIVRLKNSESK